jgi:HD-GYP domain-containing protein (c-di-GMP phosphodiesterase class II)
MGLSDSEIERVEFAGLLHDIGKIGVPDTILQKDEALTETEIEVIRASALAGAEWLAAIEGLDEVATMVRHQSERYDGTGYPDRLSGEAIPLGSRILAVAIRFSAMTKPRADRRALSVVGGALEFLAYQAGSALDPRVVKTFLAAMGRRYHQP